MGNQVTFEEVDAVITNLRRVATQLGIDGALQWALVMSVMSDEAATQTAFKRLVQERKSTATVQVKKVNAAILKSTTLLFCYF